MGVIGLSTIDRAASRDSAHLACAVGCRAVANTPTIALDMRRSFAVMPQWQGAGKVMHAIPNRLEGLTDLLRDVNERDVAA